MLGTLKKMFGSKSDRDIKSVTPLVNKIHEEYAVITKLTNDELRQKTVEFKARIASFMEEEDKEIKALRDRLENDLDIENEEKEKIYLRH